MSLAVLVPAEIRDEFRIELERLRRGMPLTAACERLSEALLEELGDSINDSPRHPWQVYAVAATLAGSVMERLTLESDALFMYGRKDMRARVLEIEARRRSRNASMGGAPTKLSDEEVSQAFHADRARYPSGRGLIKRLSMQLNVDAKTVRRKLQQLNLRD